MTKIGRRRNRNEGVQWLMIGIVLGMACSFTLGFAGYVFGLIEFSTSDGEGNGETIVVTSTVDLAALTLATTPEAPPSIIETPTDEAEATQELAPLATFTPTNLPDGSPTEDSGGQGGAPTQSVGTPPPTGILPGPPTQDTSVLLAVGATTLLAVDGGSFKMGTDLAEGQAAVADCVQLFGGTCTDAMITDSTPIHDVALDNFQIEQFEVSVIQYVNYLNYLAQQNPGTRPHLTACGGAPCALTAQDTGGEASDISYDAEAQQYTVRLAGVDRANYPVTLVTWFGADAYCKALGRFLPTEAQWERAARGIQNNIYPWGPQWDENNAKTDRPVEDGTVPVDSYPTGVSSFNVYNMSGNVAEWTADFYSANYYSQADAGGPNPRGPVSGDKKVVRGGSWSTPPIFARAVHRVDGFGPGDVSTWVGFRCADDGIGGSAVAPAPNVTPNTTSNTSNTAANPTPDTAASNPSGLGDKTGSGSGTNPNTNTTPINNPPVNIPPTATLAESQ